MIDRYPRFFFKSDQIVAARKIAQKTQEKDENACFYFIRPYSIFFSIWVVRYTNLTGNNFSVLMNILSTIGLVSIYFCSNLNQVLFLGPFFFYIVYFFDVVDGEIARLRGEQSKLGAWLDKYLWYSFPITFCIYVIKIVYFLGYSKILIVVSFLNIVLNFFSSQEFNNSQNLIDNNYQKEKSLKIIVKLVFSYFALYFLFPIFVFCFNFDTLNLPYIYITFVTIIYLLYYIYKIINIYKNLNIESSKSNK